MIVSEEYLSLLIADRLEEMMPELQNNYQLTSSEIGYFICDDLLPADVAMEIWEKFPNSYKLYKNKSLRESKHVGSNVDDFDPLMKSIIYAFQSPRVVSLIEEIVNRSDLIPDQSLYAAGLSSMSKGDFLLPHLDNAMNSDRTLWRNYNLLYYVSPGRGEEDGGNFELWPNGVGLERLTITAKFNRLVLMHCHDDSWHSVSPVESDLVRVCVSSYYFSKNKPREDSRFRVTSFRDRNPGSMPDTVLKIDSGIRNLVRKIFKFGLFNKNHIYKNKDSNGSKK